LSGCVFAVSGPPRPAHAAGEADTSDAERLGRPAKPPRE
jgi:hypothetical protein